MINKVQNFWLNRAELRKRLIREEQKKKQQIPTIYNTVQDEEIEDLCDKVQANNYQI